jgi:hypothetical protein
VQEELVIGHYLEVATHLRLVGESSKSGKSALLREEDLMVVLCICPRKCREEHCSDRYMSFILDRAGEIGRNAQYCSKAVHGTVVNSRYCITH